jgi:serine/threonine-protein kinase
MSEPASVSVRDEHDSSPSWGFAPGDEVDGGRWAIRLLGGGDRFEAWLGWDDRLYAPVVFKFLRPDQTDDRRARRAIEREAATLAAIAHPGIVRCFDARVDQARPYLVLEFLDAPRLSTLVRRFGALTHEQLVPLALEIGSALAYLHNVGLVHLDVKPQNLIMGAPPRLIDLSIARPFAELAESRGPLGTDAYMAPEQCLEDGLRAGGSATDAWGLGATLFEAATGARPFRKRRAGEPYPQLSEDPGPWPPRVPPLIRDAISACLSRDPSARPTIAEVMDAFEAMAPEAREVADRRLRRRVR